MDREDIGLAKQFILFDTPGVAFSSPLPRQVLAPGDHLHIEGMAHGCDRAAQPAQPEEAKRFSGQVIARTGLPAALAHRAGLPRDVAHKGNHQADGEFGSRAANPAGAANRNALRAGRFQVEGQIPHAGRDQKLQFRKLADQGGREGRPFAHPYDDFEISQPFGGIFLAAQVLGEYLDICSSSQPSPIRQPPGRIKVIVQNSNTHRSPSSFQPWFENRFFLFFRLPATE